MAVRIPRFVVDSPKTISAGGEVSLARNSIHHAKDVLRLKSGDIVEVAWEGCLQPWLCELTSVTSTEVTGRLVKPGASSNSFPITLCVGLPKPKIADFVVEKAVELGVQRIVFFRAQHSPEGRLNDEAKHTRLNRLQRVALSALKQSGLSTAPEIELLDSLDLALERKPSDESLLFAFCAPHYEEQETQAFEKAEHFLKVISGLFDPTHASNSSQTAFENIPQSADSILVIGPEGGLSSAEVETLRAKQFRFVSLGPRTLRVETAVVAAASLVALLYGSSP